MNIEDRIAGLEASLKTELATLRTHVEAAFADDVSWCERYWDYIALAAFAAGLLIGAVA
jgi:uncharacterized membrane protein